jgi:hypothetical protein
MPTRVRLARTDPVWLFPPTYAIHLAEEYGAAGGFADWVERVLGLPFSNAEFILWNAFALALMCVAAWLVSCHVRFRFIEIALAVAVIGNVCAHIVGSLVTWTYSPGLVTAVVVWAPLAAIRLPVAYCAASPRGRRAGVYIGAAALLATAAVVAFGTIVGQ